MQALSQLSYTPEKPATILVLDLLVNRPRLIEILQMRGNPFSGFLASDQF